MGEASPEASPAAFGTAMSPMMSEDLLEPAPASEPAPPEAEVAEASHSEPAPASEPPSEQPGVLRAAVARSPARPRAAKRRGAIHAERSDSTEEARDLPPAPAAESDEREASALELDTEAEAADAPAPAVVRAKRISGPKAEYPASALRRRVEGSVWVLFSIDARGVVRNAAIEKSEPAGVFDRAALDAIEATRYRPRTEDGAPVATPLVRKRFRFHL